MSPHIILIDADHLDRVAFDLTVNFERMLGRAIPKADLAHWLDCIALDGGLRAGDNEVQAIFIHSKEKAELQHFQPSHFQNDLHDKAFRDHLGEFSLSSFAVEPIVSQADFLVESFEAILLDKGVKSVMVVADLDGISDESAALARRIKELCLNPPRPEQGEATQTSPSADALPPKDITLFAMQPLTGRGFHQEILGYSLTSALGVRGSEF